MYELKNHQLIATIDYPYESAGYIYYYKTAANATKVILFERFNQKKNKYEYELGTFGKADFGMINENDTCSKEIFLKKVNESGQELPLDTALREGNEETDGIITTPSPNKKHYDIVTSAHVCWCNAEKDIQTIMSVVPYELTTKQYQTLLAKQTYSIFTRTQIADLTINQHGDITLTIGDIDLLTEENLNNKWRRFTQIQLTDEACKKSIHQVFRDMINQPSLMLITQENKNEYHSKANNSWNMAALIAGVTSVSALFVYSLYAKNRNSLSTTSTLQPPPLSPVKTYSR